MMKDLKGMKWAELSNEEKEELLISASTIDGITGNNMTEDGECIIDLTEVLSVLGKIEDGELVVDDESIIYNSEEGIRR